MVNRTFWLSRIEQGWRRRSLLWLRGVRRTGKTTLAQSLPDVEYFDCELPRVRRAMEDPEAFWRSLSGKRVVADEVHRVPNQAHHMPARRQPQAGKHGESRLHVRVEVLERARV